MELEKYKGLIYVKDHCMGITSFSKGKIGETYNIGTDNEISNIKLVRQICSLMQIKKPSSTNYLKLISLLKIEKVMILGILLIQKN